MIWNPFKPKIQGPNITFLPMDKTITVEEGTTVLQAALSHDIDLRHSCDGNLACSTCHVYIRSGEAGLNTPLPDEEDMLDSAENVEACSRLACQVHITHDIVVEIPASDIA